MALTADPQDVIELWTRNGPCEIQLLSGDITQCQEPVNIILVSAFPGDYSPMPSTVIGALKKNLGISVVDLARDKEMDLRHHFSCWLSRPIGTGPFKKLLCFERRRVEMTVVQQISEMFRVFVPVFNNQDNTVITPLLATGHQGYNEANICRAMIDAAAHWIQAGLPLRCLKIVIFKGISQDIRTMFDKLKEKLLAKNKRSKETIFNKKYDVYITYHPNDEGRYVKSITGSLEAQKSDIRIYAKPVAFNQQKVWQNAIFKVMVACKRVIAVLSPSFMESAECLEQYNMAMCCNRLHGADVLAPLYLESIDTLPSYMGLVQWIDCRERKAGDSITAKVEMACSVILHAIEENMLTEPASKTEMVVCQDKMDDKFSYDVFLSYSHKNPEQVEALLKIFQGINANLKVFYDRSALTTGTNWQNTLYQSIGECRCLIALLSPTYLTSAVCMEEYNLALARFMCKDKDMQFIPLVIEKVDELPRSLSKMVVTDASVDFKTVAEDVASSVCQWLDNGDDSDAINVAKADYFCICKQLGSRSDESVTKPEQYVQPERDFSPLILATITSFQIISPSANSYDLDETPMESIEATLCQARTDALQLEYRIAGGPKDRRFERIFPLTVPKREDQPINESKVDIALSFANDALYLAGTFCSLIDKYYPGLNISVYTQGGHKRLQALDQATMLVFFMSQEFLTSEFYINELHLALCRQRASDKHILYLIKTSPLAGRPFFPRILPYNIACTDPVWEDFEKRYIKGRQSAPKTIISRSSYRMDHSGNFMCDYAEYFGMTKAVEDVLEAIVNGRKERSLNAPILMDVVDVGRADSSKQQLQVPVITGHAQELETIEEGRGSPYPDSRRNSAQPDPSDVPIVTAMVTSMNLPTAHQEAMLKTMNTESRVENNASDTGEYPNTSSVNNQPSEDGNCSRDSSEVEGKARSVDDTRRETDAAKNVEMNARCSVSMDNDQKAEAQYQTSNDSNEKQEKTKSLKDADAGAADEGKASMGTEDGVLVVHIVEKGGKKPAKDRAKSAPAAGRDRKQSQACVLL